MSQCSSYDSKDLQSMADISSFLKESIVSICEICKSLKDAHVDPYIGRCSSYKKIRGHIEHAEQNLKISDKIITKNLDYVDHCLEHLSKEKGKVGKNMKENSLAMDTLHIQKASTEKLLQIYQASLMQAKRNYVSITCTLQKEQARKETAEILIFTGLAVSLIPIVGLIAGPIITFRGITEDNEASDAIMNAKVKLTEVHWQVNEYLIKMHVLKFKIIKTQCEIERTNKKLKKIQDEIDGLQHHLMVVADIQKMVRRSANLLSVLSGRVTVLERQTQRFILWEPVKKAMEDVMKAVVNIADNQFLYSDGIPGLVNTLRENIGGLQALCNLPNNSEHESYY